MCNREGCNKPSRALGYCVGHYSKFKRDRALEMGKKPINYRSLNRLEWTEEELEGLWQFVKKELKIV